MTKIKVRNVLFNILAIVTAIAVVFVLFNIFTGTKGYAVTSDSMADKLVRGDAVFSKAVSFEELKEGDIITVRVGEAGFFTHRIVKINSEERTVTTKGDANDADDPMDTKESDIVGKMRYSVPYIGYLSIIFSGKSSVKALIILVVIAVVLIALNSILSKSKKTRGDNNE